MFLTNQSECVKLEVCYRQISLGVKRALFRAMPAASEGTDLIA